MKKFLLSALALMGICATAQEKVRVHNGSESYVTTIEYVTFDVTAADDVVSVVELKSENVTLAGEKATLEGEVTSLKSANETLAGEKATLEGKVTDLTSANETLVGEKTTLEGKVSTLTSANETLAGEKKTLEDKLSSMEYALTERAKDHDYVDLGLPSKTLWATMNVGASSAEDYGDYFAWGEIETHYSAGGNTNSPTWKEGYTEGYTWGTYKWCDGSQDTMTKYCTKSTYGKVDDKTKLEDADDVAVQAWGGKRQMPTLEQQVELLNNCYWVWTTSYNGKSVNGYIVYKAKKGSDKGVKVTSGKAASADYNVTVDVHIFLPAAGVGWNTVVDYAGKYGNYWSRSLDTKYPTLAYRLYFGSDKVDSNYENRDFGFSVRPVVSAAEP